MGLSFSALVVSGSSVSILLLLAIAPSIFLLWFFSNQDRYKHESKKLLAVTFLLGALMIPPALILEVVLKELFPEGNTLLGVFLYYLLEVALIEESLKLFAVRISMHIIRGCSSNRWTG